MYNSSLVLEGGGMRGVYTAGVLDLFLDKEIEFKGVIGVSAGACTGCSFLSKQRKRAYDVMVDYLDDPRYLSIKSLLLTGNAFGSEFIFDTIPNELNLYDYEAFNNYKGRFYAVATDMKTGKPFYRPIVNMNIDLTYINASMSLPLLSKPVEIDGHQYLDGGISDSIPVKFMYDLGFKKNVVVLTRPKGYRKEKTKTLPILEKSYSEYPQLIKRMANRHLDYNNTLNLLDMWKKTGNAFVIEPSEPLVISRLEKNHTKLEALYELGYKDAYDNYDSLIEYLKI